MNSNSNNGNKKRYKTKKLFTQKVCGNTNHFTSHAFSPWKEHPSSQKQERKSFSPTPGKWHKVVWNNLLDTPTATLLQKRTINSVLAKTRRQLQHNKTVNIHFRNIMKHACSIRVVSYDIDEQDCPWSLKETSDQFRSSI